MSFKKSNPCLRIMAVFFLCVSGVSWGAARKIVFTHIEIGIAKSTLVNDLRFEYIAVQNPPLEPPMPSWAFGRKQFKGFFSKVSDVQADVGVIPSAPWGKHNNVIEVDIESVIRRVCESAMNSLVRQIRLALYSEDFSRSSPLIADREGEIYGASLDWFSFARFRIQFDRINPLYRLANFRNDPWTLCVNQGLRSDSGSLCVIFSCAGRIPRGFSVIAGSNGKPFETLGMVLHYRSLPVYRFQGLNGGTSSGHANNSQNGCAEPYKQVERVSLWFTGYFLGNRNEIHAIGFISICAIGGVLIGGVAAGLARTRRKTYVLGAIGVLIALMPYIVFLRLKPTEHGTCKHDTRNNQPFRSHSTNTVTQKTLGGLSAIEYPVNAQFWEAGVYRWHSRQRKSA